MAQDIFSVPDPQFVQRFQQQFDLFRCVVVHQTNAQHAAISFDTQALGQVDRVVVAVSAEDAAPSQRIGKFARCASGKTHCHGWRAHIETRRVADAVEGQSRNCEETGDQLLR